MAEERGGGWILFAGIMLLVAGVLNVIWGIAAIDKSSFFVADAHFIASNLNTWGWVVLIIGVLEIVAAFSIWAGGSFGRWLGILAASLRPSAPCCRFRPIRSGRCACWRWISS